MKLNFTVRSRTTLLHFLMEEKGVSRRLLNKLKHREHGLTCNGAPIRSIDIVAPGDVVTLWAEDEKYLEPNGSLHAPAAYESSSLIIFDKPGGMPVHPSIKHQGDTLGNYFAYLFPKLTFRPVNRLDKDTSGLCIIAKNAYAADLLQGNFRKLYYAAVQGKLPEYGRIDAPIARVRESIIQRCVREDGQPAVTNFRRIAYQNGYSLAEVIPETGRTHQIRVHFAHIGYPLAGDDMYGGMRLHIGRQALHCGEVTFTEPLTGEKITVRSEIPEDIKNLFKGVFEMDKIASFQVDHTKFGVGMYISRIDGDIVTYDVRMVKPNGGKYISNPSLHTIEHLFATYARNSHFGDHVIYVGPMGCRTGFYLLVRDLPHADAITLVREAYEFIADFSGEIPGCSEAECGNYLEHDLGSAKRDVLPLLKKLEGYTVEMLDYSWHFGKEIL